MNVKHFRVRVSGDHLVNDQQAINQFLNEKTVIKTATNFISGMVDYWSVLVFYDEKSEKTTNGKTPVVAERVSAMSYDDFSEEEKTRLNNLKQWRSDKAAKLNLPSYMICHNTELMTIAKLKPENIEGLKRVKGFGEHKLTKYGEDIINLLNAS